MPTSRAPSSNASKSGVTTVWNHARSPTAAAAKNSFTASTTREPSCSERIDADFASVSTIVTGVSPTFSA